MTYPDDVPIEGVEINSDNPLVNIINSYTDANGNFIVETTAPVGTDYTLNFKKDGFIIASATQKIGDNSTVVQDQNVITTTYNVKTTGYLPFSVNNPGRISELIKEDIALLRSPSDAVISPDGTKLYIADGGNKRIRVFTFGSKGSKRAEGMLTTLAGSYYSGTTDGIGINGIFNSPVGLAITKDGQTLYICDQTNNSIRKLNIPTADLTTIAGSTSAESGMKDDVGTAALFSRPFELVLNHDETKLYIADVYNNRVREIDLATNTVSTFLAGFGGCYGIAYHYDESTGSETLYVSDNTCQIYSVDVATKTRTSLAGSSGAIAYVDGVGSEARFMLPTGMAISHDGKTLYICDYSANIIRKLDIATRTVTTLAGVLPAGLVDGASDIAKFLVPYSMGISNDDKTLYIADSGNHRIRSVDTATGYTDTVVGSRAGYSDGPSGDSFVDFNWRLYSLQITNDDKYLYFADALNIGKLDLATHATQIIGPSSAAGVTSTVNGLYGRRNRGLSNDMLLSKDEQSLYISDGTCHIIRKVDVATGASTTIAGTQSASGFADGVGSAVRFNVPSYIVINSAEDTMYISDSMNSRIRKLDLTTGNVSTIAGSGAGFADGIGGAAKFNMPTGLALSPDEQFLFVADSYNHRIRKIELATNNVTTFAGLSTQGIINGDITIAQFIEPREIAFSKDGSILFVTDWGNGTLSNNIRMIDMKSPIVSVYWLAGGSTTGYQTGYNNGTGFEALMNGPSSIVFTSDGSVMYFADQINCSIRKLISVLP